MFSGGGIGVTFGSASSKQQLKQDGTTESQSASTVGSTGGNVTLVAGHDSHVAGSDVIAKQDISLVGGSVTIDPGNDTLTRHQSFEQKQSGLTLQLTSPITDALLSLGSQAKAASEAGDDRLKALGAVKALESGWAMSKGATQSATALAKGDMNNAGIKISLSVGASKSKSSSEYSSNTVSGSSLSGGGNVAVVATGKNGTSGDVILAGSGITGNNVTLAAAHDLNLVAASNNTEQKSSNKSSGWSAGVHIAIGQETGIGVQASGYMASGSENGSSTEYVNSRVNAKDNLTLSSGNDTLLSGAQALGNSISVNAGNNLTLTSLQDTDSYHSQQQSASGGFSFTFGSMTGSIGLSLSKSKVNSEYASVGDQSGLFAGNGGYDIFVGNHTQLNGAVIASTADAANNKLSTGTLGWDSIDNHASYHASSSAIGFNGSYSKTPMPSGEHYAAGALPSVVNMSDNASGTTRSAVADGTITVRNAQNQTQDVATLSRDTDNANGNIGKIFDKEKVANQMAFAQGVQELAGRVVGDVKEYKMGAASAEAQARLLKEHPDYVNLTPEQLNVKIQQDPGYQSVAAQWGTGGTYSMVATAVAGALGGLSASNLGAAASGVMAPYIANAIKQATTTYNADGTENVNLLANTMAHAVAGAVLAQISGSSASAGAAGAAGGELAARAIVKVMYPDTDISSLTENQKQIVSSLSQIAAGMAGGIASNSSMGVGAGAGAGKNAVENNFLSKGNPQKYAQEYKECHGNDSCEQKIRKNMAKESAENIQALKSCWDAGDTACVTTMRTKIELSDNAYTKLRQQDNMAGRAYEESAKWYGDIIDSCAGKCGWLEAALLKTGADGLGNIVYGSLGAGSVLKVKQGSNPVPENVVKKGAGNSQNPEAGNINKLVKNEQGIYEVKVNSTPLEGHERLNTPDVNGNGKYNPAEAAAAARLESTLGKLERAPDTGGKTADFIISGGSNAGKTVDFMYTTKNLSQKEVDGIYRFFEKNMTVSRTAGEIPTGQKQILDHLGKADIVPVDFSVLTSSNQKVFMDYIKTLPKNQQDKLIIMR
ncbi:hemagglutinin repeat-containing protein [Pantoea trifolii]|uniref:hemagglutinin repeat-containing protein n=1 Tax=Pantoea trifolii TaxID=2968030 RepID=UPI003EDA0B1E